MGGGPFSEYAPYRWKPRKAGASILVAPRGHGVISRPTRCNLNDPVNNGRSPLECVLIEYEVKGLNGPIRHELYTLNDLQTSTHDIQDERHKNIQSDIAERVARRVVKYFLQHHSPEGKVGPLFRKDFQKDREYIVAMNDRLVLKIFDKYPNMILLEKTGAGKYGFEAIAEFDGLFDYRFRNQQHLIVLETKLGGLNMPYKRLSTRDLPKLNSLFPDAQLWYITFGQQDKIYTGRPGHHQLSEKCVKTYEHMKSKGVKTLFFTFNEPASEFHDIAKHLRIYDSLTRNARVELGASVTMSDNEIIIRNGTRQPMRWITLRPDGTYEERLPWRTNYAGGSST